MITQGKNQVTIPAELARVIRNRAVLAKRLAGRGKRYLRPASDPIGDLIRERAEEDRGEGKE